MRRLTVALSLSIAAGGCGATVIKNDVSGPVAACDSFAYASCAKQAACQPAAGIDVNNCAQLLSNAEGCSKASCTTGTFNPPGAQACLDGYNNQSCADQAAKVVPTACQPGTSTVCL